MTSMITVRYFAQFRDLAGKSNETLTIARGENAATVYGRVAAMYGFPLALSDIRIAVNDEFTSAEYPLQADDHVVFIPPVSGG